jgi:replicative DNA helicase
MPAEQLMLRLLSTETSIPLQNLRVGNLTDDEWSRLIVATDKMARRKLFVDDGGYATIHHVRSKLRKLKSQHPEITMAIIDYLQLMSGDGGREGRQQEISEISRGLKQLARELQIPILALSQLNRGVESRENKRPMLSDLRESGCLSGDSMIVDAKSGKRYRIDELANNKDLLPIETKSMDKNLQVNNFTITNAFFSGEKIVYKLTTQSGKTINATANHKFYRVDGWIRLDDLSVGDKIATPDGVIIYWDEIVSIEKLEKVKTYDLTVDSVHNFVANDIIVHNSIEQDADIVMFVYRDDVYREAAEKEKEMKAKANGQEYDNKYQKKMEEETELIVGKQRNGPTGTVRLIFQKRFTRFVDDHKGADTPFEVIYEEGGNMDTRDMGHIDFTPPF